jgi:hypothetical protein
MNTLTRVSMYVDESEYECLGAISKVTGTPVAGLVRQAIDQWLRRVHDGEEELPGWLTRSQINAVNAALRVCKSHSNWRRGE